jgi:superfamily II DNA helicase RecQ
MASEVTWQSHPPEMLLRERFHIRTGFHPGQRDIIEQLAQGKRGKRLLVIQRTGWGKSVQVCTEILQSHLKPHFLL